VVMLRAEGNQSKAADWLGINRNTLRRKLLEHKLIK
jgi:Fis family transcriptional regulator